MGFASNYSRMALTRNNTDRSIREQEAGLLRGNATSGYRMFINKGQDDEMEICYYRSATIKIFFTWLFIIATGGVLRLIFHWVPHWYLFATCIQCDITEAEKILVIEIFKGKHKLYYVKKLKVLTPENVRELEEDNKMLNPHHEDITDTPASLSVHFERGIFRDVDKLLLFNCKKVTYIWDTDKQEFIKLRGLDEDVSSDILHKNKGLSATEQLMRRLVYGPNKILVEESSILTLLFLEVLNPFYIFQIASFILWFCDDYFFYAAAIMAMSAFGIIMTVRQTRKNQRNLKSTVHSSDVCTVLRKLPKTPGGGDFEYKSEVISTELLVPGDIVEIPSHGCIMHCDAVLLTGNCILNESMLTGESVPVTKTAFPSISGLIYDSKEHARHTLFCGTRVIQTRYFGNEKVLAVVIRTGFSTAKGSLVRSILYPPPVDFRFEKDSYRFVALLALIAFVGFAYTIVTKVLRGIRLRDLILEAFDLITIVVPPALPAAMTVGSFYAQIRLKKNNIFCISPRSINVAGSINCVCFDKTGTLTEDGLDLLCVVPIENKTFLTPCKNVEALPYNTFVCGLVSCHSLTIIDKQIVGDPLDLKMFESTKWTMEDPEIDDNNKFDVIFPTVLKPPKNRPVENQNIDEDLQIGIIREFPFSSSAQRMGVIIRKLGAQHFEYYSKGSPEMILNFVKKETIPHDFHDILESYTQEGYRVIALAHKELKMSYAKVQKVHREVIEKDMNLLGLIVLENRLKPDTTPCIQILNEAEIRVIMVTGDNILTALSVAKDCDIVKTGQSVITVNCDASNPPQLYYTLTNTKPKYGDNSILSNSVSVMSMDTLESQLPSVTASNSCKTALRRPVYDKENNLDIEKGLMGKPSSLCNNYRFAMTGKVWAVVREHYPELTSRLVTRGAVFARMSPEQKQQLVQELQTLGYCVAMCGDGANDCGALKAAHTGISLSEAESSVASPFTSKTPDITCVINVIKEGRAALVTSFGIFKYMASYSLCQFVSVMILYSIDSNLTDFEFLYIDLFIISTFAFFFGKSGAYSGKLVKETPLTSLMNLTPIISLLLQVILFIIFQVAAFLHLKSEPWYVAFDPANTQDKDDNACLENYTIYTISSFQYIILAIVYMKGKPYRESLFKNPWFIGTAVTLTSFSIYLAVYPSQFLRDHFQLILPDSMNFRLYLLAYAFVNFILSLIVEHLIVEYFLFKKLRYKFHNIEKSKKKYLAIEKDLDNDTKWPVLTSDYKSAASPQEPEPSYVAEIVVEKENKFDKNHVLNKLYETSGNFTYQFDAADNVQRSFSLDLGDLERSDIRKDDPNVIGQSIPNVRQNLGSPLHKFSLISNTGNKFENIIEDSEKTEKYSNQNGNINDEAQKHMPKFELHSINVPNGFSSDKEHSPNCNGNDDLPFSSLPSINEGTSSDVFQSVGSQNTTYDVAHSHFNIDELPYDNSTVLTTNISPPKVVFNSFPNTPLKNNHNNDLVSNLPSFNSLGRKIKPKNDNILRALEMDNFQNRIIHKTIHSVVQKEPIKLIDDATFNSNSFLAAKSSFSSVKNLNNLLRELLSKR